MTAQPKPDIRQITRLVGPEGNLVQGQSELPLPDALARAAAEAIAEGLNHYTFFEGVPELRRELAAQIREPRVGAEEHRAQRALRRNHDVRPRAVTRGQVRPASLLSRPQCDADRLRRIHGHSSL